MSYFPASAICLVVDGVQGNIIVFTSVYVGQVHQYIVRLVTIILNMIIITVGMATINKISLVVVLIGILLIAAALISWYLRTH
ncbi:MAG: hypothetical protein ACJ73C_17585 [Nitrososphaeraceae archaeon]